MRQLTDQRDELARTPPGLGCEWTRGHRRGAPWYTILLLVTSQLLAGAALPGEARALAWILGGGPWPESSEQPVQPLDHPTLEQWAAEAESPDSGGLRFVVFGDQRALADGEWQAILQGIVDVERRRQDPLPLRFVLDSGDIVDDGSHSDQFHMLREILRPLRAYPYLVGIGNHEVDNNRPGPARAHTALFLRHAVPELAPDRLYYRRDIGSLRLICLDTNDLVYGPQGNEEDEQSLSARGREQLVWLREQLADPEGARRTVVVAHHPFVSSSQKHAHQGAKLWSLELEGVSVPAMLAAGGVDVVVAGHTHTYERFRLIAPDGGRLHVVNLSGRPRDSFLWFGAGSRRANDIRGREIEHLRDEGWAGLDGWIIEQRDAMLVDEENQWAQFRLEEDGTLSLELFYLRDRGKGGYREKSPVILD